MNSLLIRIAKEMNVSIGLHMKTTSKSSGNGKIKYRANLGSASDPIRSSNIQISRTCLNSQLPTHIGSQVPDIRALKMPFGGRSYLY